jgi:hypothetical protein
MNFDGLARIGTHQLYAHDRGHHHDPIDFDPKYVDAGASVTETGRLLCLHTFRAAGWVRLSVVVHPAAPPPPQLEAAVITELSLEIASGELVINGIDALSSVEGFGSVQVPAGWWRVRVTQRDQDTAPYDYGVGADTYALDLWRAPAAPVVVLAKTKAVDGLERVHRRLAKGDAGSTKLATLARALARGAAEAATEALALAVSADVAERMDAANLIAFAPLDTARALNERLTKDTDERVRDQTEMGWSMASERS